MFVSCFKPVLDKQQFFSQRYSDVCTDLISELKCAHSTYLIIKDKCKILEMVKHTLEVHVLQMVYIMILLKQVL